MKIFFRKIKNKRIDSFTLVETLIAIFIFSASLVSLMVISSRGITASRNAQNNVIASGLAQEGVEFVYHLRNNYAMDSTGGFTWVNLIQTGGPFYPCLSGDCEINYDNLSIQSCNECNLYLNDNHYVYTGSLEEKTNFIRKINMLNLSNIDGDDLDLPDEFLLKVTVSWMDGLRDRSIVLEEYLTNWQPILHGNNP